MAKRRRNKEGRLRAMQESDGATTGSDGATTGSDGATTESDGATAESDGATTESDGATAESYGATAESYGATAEDDAAKAEGDIVTAESDTEMLPEALRRAAEAVWVASQKGAPWATLAIVPAEPGLQTDALARAVAEVGSEQRGEPVEFLDLRDVTLANSRSLVETLALSAAFRHVVALGCPTDNRAAELLATSAAAVVLIVEREATRVTAARRVVEAVGPERFLGAVVLEPEP
jgi:hypothetical protein